jgi:replicative DNA helicase
MTDIKKDFGNARTRKPDLTTLVFGKVPPQAVKLEEAIIGALLMEKERIQDIMDIIPKPECFYVDQNQRIYNALITLHTAGKAIDILTIAEQLGKTNELEISGGMYYMAQITRDVVSAAHVEAHARIVMEKYIQRELIRISGQTIGDAYDDSSDVFDLLGSHEYEISQLNNIGDADTIAHINEAVKDVMNDIDDLQSGKKKFMGVPTGIYMLDQLTKGWQDTDLVILAARPSQGKTALVLHHVLAAAMSGIGVLFFSLEMSRNQLVQRLISNHSQIPLEKIKTGEFNPQEQKTFNASASYIASLPIYIDDRAGNSIQRICSKVKSYKRKGKIGLVAIDYLQLASVQDSRQKNREQQIAEMSRCLKVCAKDCEVPMLVLSQMNRGIDAAKRKPELSDLRESGAIEQDADIVVFIHHENAKTWLVVRKHRNGQTDEIEVVFLGAIQKFVDPNEVNSYSSFKAFSPALTQAAQSIYNNETF